MSTDPLKMVKGVPVFDLDCDELNHNWLANQDLIDLAAAGVPQARDLLILMDGTPMERINK